MIRGIVIGGVAVVYAFIIYRLYLLGLPISAVIALSALGAIAVALSLARTIRVRSLKEKIKEKISGDKIPIGELIEELYCPYCEKKIGSRVVRREIYVVEGDGWTDEDIIAGLALAKKFKYLPKEYLVIKKKGEEEKKSRIEGIAFKAEFERKKTAKRKKVKKAKVENEEKIEKPEEKEEDLDEFFEEK